ncbi:MAG: hypothetical protein U1E83_05445 [Methylotetracoccus sp.]
MSADLFIYVRRGDLFVSEFTGQQYIAMRSLVVSRQCPPVAGSAARLDAQHAEWLGSIERDGRLDWLDRVPAAVAAETEFVARFEQPPDADEPRLSDHLGLIWTEPNWDA